MLSETMFEHLQSTKLSFTMYTQFECILYTGISVLVHLPTSVLQVSMYSCNLMSE